MYCIIKAMLAPGFDDSTKILNAKQEDNYIRNRWNKNPAMYYWLIPACIMYMFVKKSWL